MFKVLGEKILFNQNVDNATFNKKTYEMGRKSNFLTPFFVAYLRILL